MILLEVDRVKIPSSEVHANPKLGEIIGIGCDQLCIVSKDEDDTIRLIRLDEREQVSKNSLVWSREPLDIVVDTRRVIIGS